MGQEKALVQRKLCSYNRKSYKEYIISVSGRDRLHEMKEL